MTSLTLSLDKRSLIAYFNGIVLPHLDYADVVWGDQPGLTTQIKQSHFFQNRCAKIVKAKATSISWGPDIVAVDAIREAYWSLINIVCRCIEVNDPRTFRCPACVQFYNEHGYNTQNGYMP